MDNRKLLEEILRTFDDNDTDRLLSLVTDDFEWSMAGSDTAKGKETIRAMFKEMEGLLKISNIVRNHEVLEGNTAVCDGHQTITKDGKTRQQFYCDIYEFQQGKLKRMISYIVDEK